MKKQWIIFVWMVFVIGCGSNSGSGHGVYTPAMDGTWLSDELSTDNCGDTYHREYRWYEIVQDGSKLAIKAQINIMNQDGTSGLIINPDNGEPVVLYGDGSNILGNLNGQIVTWNYTQNNGGGEYTAVQFSGIFSNDSYILRGSSTWTRTRNDNTTCTGSTTVYAMLQPTTYTYVGGSWQCLYDINETTSKEFTMTLSQDITTLSGTLTVPDLGITGATVQGTVTGLIVVFSDTEGRISFTGTASRQSAAGTYRINGTGATGIWTAFHIRD